MATVEGERGTEDSVSGSSNSVPSLPPDSPGSSVSTRMQDEYDELLKYAVVVPNLEQQGIPLSPGTLRDVIFAPRDVTVGLTGQKSTPTAMAAATAAAGGNNNNGDGGGGSAGVSDDADASESTEEGSTPTPSVSETSSDARNARFYNAVHAREVDRFLATHLQRGDAAAGGTPSPGDAVVDAAGDADADSVAHLKLDAQFNDNNNAGELLGGALSPPPPGTIFSPGMDPDIARMDTLLDLWLADLKKNVLAEFGQCRIRQMEEARHMVRREQEKHAAEMTSLRNELESVRELLHTYEQSVARKDDVIANLTRGMRAQRDRMETLKAFSEWRIKHNDAKREAFASTLAARHYERTLARRAWAAWRAIIENSWRQRVERACQAKAQEVCVQLTDDYERKINQLHGEVLAAQEEASRLRTERERYEDAMKKAFMRGVCALNMEAMSMFQPGETDRHPDDDGGGGPRPHPDGGGGAGSGTQHPDHSAPTHRGLGGQTGGGIGGQQQLGVGGSLGGGVGVHPAQFLAQQVTFPDHLGAPVSIPQEALFTTEPPGAPPPRVVTSQSATRSAAQPISTKATGGAPKTKPAGTRPRVLHTRITGASRAGADSGRGGACAVSATLAPPMSSVVVERHQAVNKQTIGHATAMRYPKHPPGGGALQRKVAGQSGQPGGVQAVKVVQ